VVALEDIRNDDVGPFSRVGAGPAGTKFNALQDRPPAGIDS